MLSKENDTIREAVGVFQTADTFQEAIDELLQSGFDRAELGLVASEQAVEAKLGHRYKKVGEVEDNDSVPRAAYVSLESIGDAEGALIGGLTYVGAGVGAIVASAGALATAITGGALGGSAGAVIGSVLAKLVGDHHAHYLQEQLDRGGLLLWVRTWDEEDEKRAVTILKKHSGRDVHVHAVPVS
jgi:hypothetical protein